MNKRIVFFSILLALLVGWVFYGQEVRGGGEQTKEIVIPSVEEVSKNGYRRRLERRRRKDQSTCICTTEQQRLGSFGSENKVVLRLRMMAC